MVRQSIWIGIVIAVFFVGIGLSYAHFANTYDPMSMKFQNQELFDQMVSQNPKMTANWMETMMQDAQFHDQVMEYMAKNPEQMNQWMIHDPKHVEEMSTAMKGSHDFMMEMMEVMMNDPALRVQVIGHMTENPESMEQMKKMMEQDVMDLDMINTMMNDPEMQKMIMTTMHDSNQIQLMEDMMDDMMERMKTDPELKQAMMEHMARMKASKDTMMENMDNQTMNDMMDGIHSFEECEAAGNLVMESYPRQCRTADGKHFVEIIPGKEQCEIAGGLWGIWGNQAPAIAECNPSTSDGGKECSDSSQCQSFCQAKEGSEINSESVGMCYGYELAICMQEVRNGVAQNEWCQ